jgi:hypothetical protein
LTWFTRASGLHLVEARVLGQVLDEGLLVHEVAGDHGEGQLAVLADLLARVECVEEVGHHVILAQRLERLVVLTLGAGGVGFHAGRVARRVPE